MKATLNVRFNTIYILKNKCNDKIYIGQTWQETLKQLSIKYKISQVSIKKLLYNITYYDPNFVKPPKIKRARKLNE